MDVEIREDDDSPAQCKIYNIEAQDYKEKFLQKRGRFYQARQDSKGLKRGDKNWNKLPELYVIFITTYDPFGKDYMIYTFENTCRLHPDIDYNDGLKFIYFNTVGTKGGSESIFQLLQYLNCSKIELVTNPHIAQLHSYVSDLKQESEVKNRYMTWGEYGERVVQEILEIREEELKIRENEFKLRENMLKSRDEELKSRDEELKSRDEELKSRDEELKSRDEELKSRDEELKSRDEELKSRDEELKSREEHLESLAYAKASRNLLVHLLTTKFENIPDTFFNKLQTASEEEINKWLISAVTADSIENFQKR